MGPDRPSKKKKTEKVFIKEEKCTTGKKNENN